MSNNKEIGFAVVGAGHIGRRHANIINGFSGASLMAVVDIDENAKNHELYPSGIPFQTSLAPILENDEVEVVNICTPNGLHSDIAIECLAAGKHVVIEKPMGLSKAKCEEVIFKALNMSKQVFVVKQNRYSPPSKWLKEVVSSDTIGKVEMVQINCYWNRDERYYKVDHATGERIGWKGSLDMDGGTLFTQFSHFIDIMYWVFGDVKNIQSSFADFTHARSTDFEDSGLVQFEFVNGGLGCINFSTAVWDKNQESSITVIGEKGSLKIGGQYMNEIEYCHIEDYTMPELPPTNPPNDYGPFKGSAANHHYVIENVVNTLRGKDTITANALEGLKIVDIIERIYKSRDLKALKG